MATLEEIVVELIGESQQLRAEMKSASDAVNTSTGKMEKAVEEFSKNSNKNIGFFQQTMATMAGFIGGTAVLGAFGAVKDAVKFLAAELMDGVAAANAEEQALTQLAGALASSGNFSRNALRDLADFAGQMEETTGFADDLIAKNLALLESMTNLDANGLKKVSMGAADLAVRFGKDLDTSTKAVAMAIEGSGGALKKMGIDLDLTNDKAKNFEIVMDAISKTAGGAAAANMNTFAGAILGLRNSYGNMVEAASNAITKNEVVIAVIRKASDVIKGMTDTIANGGTAVRDGIGQALIDLIGTLQSLTSGFSTFVKFTYAGFATLENGISALYNGFMALGFVMEGNSQKAGEYWDKIVASSEKANQAWANIDKEGFLDKVAISLGEIKDSAQSAYGTMSQSAMDTIPALTGIQNQQKEISRLTDEQKAKLQEYAQALANTGGSVTAFYDQAQVDLENSIANEEISKTEYFARKQALLQEQLAFELATLNAHAAATGLTDEQMANARLTLQQKYGQDSRKLEADRSKQQAADLKSTFGTIASLSESGNRELAAIGKAAAIANATVDGIAAVQKALASAPPPLNFGLAALVGAATAANVAKIAGAPGLARGMDSVPGIGNQDNFPSVLAPGERVVPSETNKDLTEFLRNASSGAREVNINLTITASPGVVVSREFAAEIVEGLNTLWANGGNKLIGAT